MHQIALEVDRILELSLSNYEFEILVEIIADSDSPEQTAKNIIHCGPKAAWYIIGISKKK